MMARRIPQELAAGHLVARADAPLEETELAVSPRQSVHACGPAEVGFAGQETRHDEGDSRHPVEGTVVMRLDAATKFWVVTDPGPHSDLGDICFQTTLAGLRLQFAGGLTMDQNPVLFTKQREAQEEAKNRLAVWRIARQIRAERDLSLGEVVKVVLHDEDGKVIWRGEVR